jgi:hypothetical protein
MTALWRMGHQRSVMRITSASDDDRRLAGDHTTSDAKKKNLRMVIRHSSHNIQHGGTGM